MIHVSAPGKLMVAGEWAVLEGSKCIVAAVDKRVHVEIEESNEIIVSLDDFGIKDAKAEFDGKKLKWLNASPEDEGKLIFMKGAIETVLQYLGSRKTFHIRSWGEESQINVDGTTKKVGFGSSAAAIVAAVAAILKFHGIGISSAKEKEIIYKLSAIAHYFAQGKVGSAFDVAASTYGNVIVYRKFDAEWLIKKLESETVKKIAGEKWPGFYVEGLDMTDFTLLVGWTKESASTSAMIKQMQSFRQSDKTSYDRIYGGISSVVEKLIDAIRENDHENILKMISSNEELLRELTKKSGVNIETPSLRKLSEIAAKYGCAGKMSGAGGGDCGIAVCFGRENARKVREAWIKSGLYIIDAGIDDGVRQE